MGNKKLWFDYIVEGWCMPLAAFGGQWPSPGEIDGVLAQLQKQMEAELGNSDSE